MSPPENRSHRVPFGAPLLALLALLVGLLAPRLAFGWVEVHVLGDDARVAVDSAGKARIEHRVEVRVGGGPLESFDVRGVPDSLTPEPDAYVVSERGARLGTLTDAVPASLEHLAATKAEGNKDAVPATLRVRFGPDGLSRGNYVIVLRYRTHLASAGQIQPDGALLALTFRGPTWPDGYESARVVFELPPGPTAPRVADGDETRAPGVLGETVLSTLRRTADKDELELVRPYAPLGEALLWTVRVDPRALGALPAPAPVELPPAGAAPTRPPGGATPLLPEPVRRGLLFGGGALLWILYATLVISKSRTVERLTKARGTTPRPLVPLHPALRGLFAGLALAVGVGLQATLKSALPGALLVLLAAALAVHKTPLWKRATRGPGLWLSISEAEAFRRPPVPRGAWLDASTRSGKWTLGLAFVLFGAASYAASRLALRYGVVVAMDFVAVLALLGTGRSRELPPDAVVDAAPPLSALAARLRKLAKRRTPLRIVPRIRVPEGQPDADELRLLVLPERPLPGLLGIEIGLVHLPGAGGALAMPEILLRLTKDSVAEAQAAVLARSGRKVRGRKPDEIVVTLAPRLPTVAMTAELVTALASRLAERGQRPEPAKRAPERKKAA